jgi:hypothetical protein
MSNSLPEALQAMIKHAAETHKLGEISKAETRYLAALQYSENVYHKLSPVTGIVLLEIANFYETSGQKRKAAVAVGRANAILHAHART